MATATYNLGGAYDYDYEARRRPCPHSSAARHNDCELMTRSTFPAGRFRTLSSARRWSQSGYSAGLYPQLREELDARRLSHVELDSKSHQLSPLNGDVEAQIQTFGRGQYYLHACTYLLTLCGQASPSPSILAEPPSPRTRPFMTIRIYHS